jgi:general secretion pathway protein G
MARRTAPLRVFFPWERRRGLVGRLGRTRARMVVFSVFVIAFLFLLRKRESHKAHVRATRASITSAIRAVASFRADHGGACPKTLADLTDGRYALRVPEDAWGRPLRVTCPGRRDPQGFEVSSDGPDGEPFGLDRVE